MVFFGGIEKSSAPAAGEEEELEEREEDSEGLKKSKEKHAGLPKTELTPVSPEGDEGEREGAERNTEAEQQIRDVLKSEKLKPGSTQKLQALAEELADADDVETDAQINESVLGAAQVEFDAVKKGDDPKQIEAALKDVNKGFKETGRQFTVGPDGKLKLSETAEQPKGPMSEYDEAMERFRNAKDLGKKFAAAMEVLGMFLRIFEGDSSAFEVPGDKKKPGSPESDSDAPEAKPVDSKKVLSGVRDAGGVREFTKVKEGQIGENERKISQLRGKPAQMDVIITAQRNELDTLQKISEGFDGETKPAHRRENIEAVKRVNSIIKQAENAKIEATTEANRLAVENKTLKSEVDVARKMKEAYGKIKPTIEEFDGSKDGFVHWLGTTLNTIDVQPDTLEASIPAEKLPGVKEAIVTSVHSLTGNKIFSTKDIPVGPDGEVTPESIIPFMQDILKKAIAKNEAEKKEKKETK